MLETNWHFKVNRKILFIKREIFVGSRRTVIQSTAANSQGSNLEYEFRPVCKRSIALLYSVFWCVHSNNF